MRLPFSRKAADRPSARKSNTLKPMHNFLKGLSETQRKDLFYFLRTGEDRGVNMEIIRKFSTVGLDAAEERSRGKGTRYSGKFSNWEKKEIKKQANDFLGIFFPFLNLGEKANLLRIIRKDIVKIQRKHVERAIYSRSQNDAFRSGRMYLEALDPDVKKRVYSRKKELLPSRASAAGYWDERHHEDRIILAGGRGIGATPIHELTHMFFGPSEFRAYLTQFYYELKADIAGPVETRISMLKKINKGWAWEAARAFEVAKELNSEARKMGRDVADRKLRESIIADMGMEN